MMIILIQTSLLLCYVFSSCVDFQDENMLGEIFNFPINEINSPIIEKIINDSQRQIAETGAFKIENFLSSKTIDALLESFKKGESTNAISWAKIPRTVFQKTSIGYSNLGLNHPFNKLLDIQMGFFGTESFYSQLVPSENKKEDDPHKIILSIYNLYKCKKESKVSKYFYQFLSKINNNVEFYPSNDKFGSIYGLIGKNTDYITWHFDEHPFSCIWVIKKGKNGGQFNYVHFNPILLSNINNISNSSNISDGSSDDIYWKHKWDINLLNQLVNDYPFEMKGVSYSPNAKSGDFYCFWGNVTLHSVSPIIKDNNDDQFELQRQVLATTFHTQENFKHSYEINENKYWNGNLKGEL